MKKLATALALLAFTAGSLIATEGASFAAVRHGKRGHRIVSTTGRAIARRAPARKKVRRHRKAVKASKTKADPGMNPISA